MEDETPDTVWRGIPAGPTRELVLRKLERLFPPTDLPEVLAMLDEYGTKQHEPELERVQLAILKLSGGDKDLLRQWVETAKMDYRDALAYAEYPRQMSSGASSFGTEPGTLRRIESADRREYLEWLREDDERAPDGS